MGIPRNLRGKTVLLHRTRGIGLDSRKGFYLLAEDGTPLVERFNYVQLKNVTFTILQDKKLEGLSSGNRTLHAFAKGTLHELLRDAFMPGRHILDHMLTLPTLKYSPHDMGNFYVKETGQDIWSATDLYAFNNEIKIFI